MKSALLNIITVSFLMNYLQLDTSDVAKLVYSK